MIVKSDGRGVFEAELSPNKTYKFTVTKGTYHSKEELVSTPPIDEMWSMEYNFYLLRPFYDVHPEYPSKTRSDVNGKYEIKFGGDDPETFKIIATKEGYVPKSEVREFTYTSLLSPDHEVDFPLSGGYMSIGIETKKGLRYEPRTYIRIGG